MAGTPSPPPSPSAEPFGIPTDATAATHTALAQLIARVVSLLAVVASTALVTRRMGTDFADWATVLSTVSLVGVLLEPGLAPVLVKRLSTDTESAPRPGAVLPVRLLLGLLAFAVLVAVVVATRGSTALALAVLLGAQVLPRALILHVVPWLQVDQRLHRQTMFEAGTSMIGLAALAIGIQAGAPVPVLGVLAFTGPLSLLAVLMQDQLRRTPSRAHDSTGPQPEKVRSVLWETAPLAVVLAVTAAYTRTSIAFVNAHEGDAAASRFFFAFLFAEQAMVAGGIVAGAVLPLLAFRARRHDLTTDVLTHRLLVAVTAIGALGSAALLTFAVPLTRLIGGADLTGAEFYVDLLAPTAAVILPAMTLGQVYVSMGRTRRYVWFATVGLLANLALNFALTPTFGAAASARITWATELVVMTAPLLHAARSGRGGARSVLAVAALAGAAVVGSELTARSVLPDVAGGLLLAGVVIAVAHRRLWWLVETVLRRPEARSSAG